VSDEAICDLARHAGIAVEWADATDRPQRVSTESLARILQALGLPCASAGQIAESKERLRQWRVAPPLLTTTVGAATLLPDQDKDAAAELVFEDGRREAMILRSTRGAGVSVPPIAQAGYHRLRYADREIGLAVAPGRCVAVPDIAPNRKLWGLAVQLYSLRRPDDSGFGDTSALASLAEAAARRGADVLALSPTHSLYPADPSRYAPYSPSSRLFLNPLLADPATVFGKARIAAVSLGETPSEDAPLINWPEAAHRKYALLRRLFDDFVARDVSAKTPLAADFDTFVREGGEQLREHARFEALQGPDPEAIQYHLFQQWIADRAFAAAQAGARAAGMCIGLVNDLAIGIDPGGSQAAARPADLLAGLTIGAPPDSFNPRGQDWGLTSFSPQALIAGGFEPFLATLRASMRHAGGVRIDHAMGLMRLWLVPEGGSPMDGAYLAYPVDDLLRLLALESHRHRAIVIGEDLGTVPLEFRRRCREAGIAGMDVLWFQREGTRFMSPAEWRADAVAMTTTHDLPTVAGWWQGADLELRRGLGTLQKCDVDQRAIERLALWQAFAEAGVAEGPLPPPNRSAPAVDAALGFVAQAPAPLALVPLEDVMGRSEQPNLPGTTFEHPNWRHRFAEPATELLDHPTADKRLRILAGHRP
jgi:4-alpha-glucanotransferase